MSRVEELYANAFAAAEQGKALEESRTDLKKALESFQSAIRILSRLAIVESASKKELLKCAIQELQERVTRIENNSEFMLNMAMDVHSRAREAEGRGELQQSIDLHLAAGDWYMKVYNAETNSSIAIREQIEYIIDHVANLKAMQAQTKPVHVTTMDVPSQRSTIETIEWPAPPTDLASVSSIRSHTLAPFSITDQEVIGAGEDGYSWPLPHLPEAPVANRRHSGRRSITPSTSQTSSTDQLSPLHPPVAPPPSLTPPSSLPIEPVTIPDSNESMGYSIEELDVLRRSSHINGHLFVPWFDTVDTQVDTFSSTPFTDPDGFLPLSAKQVSKQATYMRPCNVCTRTPVMIDSGICFQVVKQDIVTDCSFVASLCIAAAYEQRFQKRLITHSIYPRDPVTLQPIYNPSGKYHVKLWINGVFRKVVIDDYLPMSMTTSTEYEWLCSRTTRPNELWVSLMEKAYLKVWGGYEYPGGNSGIDLFALTGWIPERISLGDLNHIEEGEVSNISNKEDRLWEQLKSAFHYGDCIITLSTGEIDPEQVKQVGLVPMHVYAVLNVYETQTRNHERIRLLHVKNPWRKLSWRGPYSKYDDLGTWTTPNGIGHELRAYEKKYYQMEVPHLEDNGMFWIDLASVKIHFESLYLNWNPQLFPHKYVIHEHWPVTLGPFNDSITLGYNPQYSLVFQQDKKDKTTVWLLLTRHIHSVDRADKTESQQYLTLHVYAGTHGRRVVENHNALYRGTYSNNPHTLVSLDIDLEKDQAPTYTLVASQFEKVGPLDYTLSIFSTTEFICRPIPQFHLDPHAIAIPGEWTYTTGGGRPFCTSFMNNPQFHVQLSPIPDNVLTAHISIFLEAENLDASPPMNLRVVLNSRERLISLPSVAPGSAVLSSGEYRPGFCQIEIKEAAEVNDMVVIPSTFEAKTLGKFIVRIISSPPTREIKGKCLPLEGEGMECKILQGRWDLDSSTAAGCASYGRYTFNPKYLVHITEETTMFTRLLMLPDTNTADTITTPLPSLNVSIYASTLRGALLLSTNPKIAYQGATSANGAYTASEDPCGVVTPYHITFTAGWYMIIPSTYHPYQSTFEMRVYTSKSVDIQLH